MKIREGLMFYFGVWSDNILFVYGSVLSVFLAPIPVLIVSLTLCVPRMASPSKAYEGASCRVEPRGL